MGEFDTVIRGGAIVHGSGRAPFTGDAAFEDGVVAVGAVSGGAEHLGSGEPGHGRRVTSVPSTVRD